MKSFKTELLLNNKQRTLMLQHAGCARFAYNWGVALTHSILDFNRDNPTCKQKFPSAIDLHKRFVAEVKPTNLWLYNSSKCAPQQALRDLRVAWDRAFKKVAKPPKFHKKGVKDSFYLEGSRPIKVESYGVKLPKIGWVKTYERLPAVQPKNVRIVRKANRWFISFRIPRQPMRTPKDSKVVGVDLGIKTLAVCSDGTEIPNVKAYRRMKRKLAKLHRNLSRKQKGSNNHKKAVNKLANTYFRVSCIRKDASYKATTWLTKNHDTIVIEDLNISGMLKKHRLANAIADAGLYEFRRQLKYKAEWYGSNIVVADRWFPSSQLCSDCGHRQKMPLQKRIFNCEKCDISKDRDLNAALNLESYLAHGSGVKGCGVVHKLIA